MATTTLAQIPARMHFPYARRVARRRYPIRLISWTDRWIAWRDGTFQLLVTGQAPRVVQAGDLTEDDLLSWNWTTLPVGCEGIAETVDGAELLRIRPFDALPAAADPLGLACERPVISRAIEPVGWPEVQLPTIDGKARLVAVRLGLPVTLPPRPEEPEWVPGRRRNRPAAAGGGGGGGSATPVIAITAYYSRSWPGCVPLGGENLQYDLERIVVRMVNGVPGREYPVDLTPLFEMGDLTLLWSGTLRPGEAHTWRPNEDGVPVTVVIAPGTTQTYLARAIWAETVVATASHAVVAPGWCAGS
jgi:hypothetical protein